MDKYNKILEDIEKAAVTLSLTSDPEVKDNLRNLMRQKIQEALNDSRSKKEIL